MALWQGRSRRKPTGGRYRPFRKKRRREIGREQQWAFIGPQRLKLYRTKGANRKVRVLSAEFANVLDRKTSVTKKVKIVTVKANPSNPNFVTRNIITRGATIQTDLGLARVTSRPVPGLHEDRVGIRCHEARVSCRLRLELLRGGCVVQVGLQDPFVDEEVPPGGHPFRVEALARNRIPRAVVVKGELRGCDPLPNLLAERRKTREDRPGAESAADLIGQRTENEWVEEDCVSARLGRLRGPRQRCDSSGFLSGLLRLELGELRSTSDPMTARFERHEGANREVETRPVVVALRAVRRGKEVLVFILPEGARTLLRALVERSADRGLHVPAALVQGEDLRVRACACIAERAFRDPRVVRVGLGCLRNLYKPFDRLIRLG